MRHWISLALYGATLAAGLGALRAIWLVAQSPSPEREPGEVRFHTQLGESTARGDRLRLGAVCLAFLAVILGMVAWGISHGTL